MIGRAASMHDQIVDDGVAGGKRAPNPRHRPRAMMETA
jgi:hypothetical protein